MPDDSNDYWKGIMLCTGFTFATQQILDLCQHRLNIKPFSEVSHHGFMLQRV